MARRNPPGPPKKYTKSGRLSAAWQQYRERSLNRAIKETNKQTKKSKALAEKREYVKRAKRLSKFVPELREYKSAETIDTKAIRRIKRREKQLVHAYNLRPVSKSFAKRNPDLLIARGVHAIQLSDTSSTAKITGAGKDMFVTSNGRTWLYWKLDRETVKGKRTLKSAGQKAFDMQFPIERLQRLAEIAFKKFKPLGISLWSVTGRTSQIHRDIEDFIRFVNAHWQAGKYISSPNVETGRSYKSNPEEWVNGLAILIKDGH